jgi:hypothetical protein
MNSPPPLEQYSPRKSKSPVPIFSSKKIRTADSVSMWEQLGLGRIIQNCWSDNCVSQTVNFNPSTESDTLEKAITQTIPFVKTVSVLPQTAKGSYKQMPYEGITKEVYLEMKSKIKKVNWKKFSSDGIMPTGCSNEGCQL